MEQGIYTNLKYRQKRECAVGVFEVRLYQLWEKVVEIFGEYGLYLFGGSTLNPISDSVLKISSLLIDPSASAFCSPGPKDISGMPVRGVLADNSQGVQPPMHHR